MKQILITGHLGLVGRHLEHLLLSKGYRVLGFDLADQSGDICNEVLLKNALTDCHGVIHLAAVSRVVWGEQNPIKCWNTNALASESLLKSAVNSANKPWVLVASSREVYGEPTQLPVAEDMPLLPVNIYGRAKLYMEKAAFNARTAGLNTAVVRLANVYGCTNDHADRVLPAFCRNAALGQPLRVDGLKHLFDFTHISDTVKGLAKMTELMFDGEKNLPAIHLLPGVGTSLKQAAEWAVSAAKSNSNIVETASRTYDVARFFGDPARAKSILGWQAKILPKQGIEMLVEDYKTQINTMVCT